MQKKTPDRYFDFSGRSSGILLHLSSLPGQHGSGDLGEYAYHFLEVLEQAGQTWWQMLPVVPPGNSPSFSPYDSVSGFAGSPWFISLKLLAGEGLLKQDELQPETGFSGPRINFPAMQHYRENRLRRAFRNFMSNHYDNESPFKIFCETNANWLDDFDLFMALRLENNGKPWPLWNEGLRTRQPEDLAAARQRLSEETAYYRFIQFKFDQQWKRFREESHHRGIQLIGDIPIFVSHNSADVWSHQELFSLDISGNPGRVSGYPPDRYNKRGQLWGHPQYEWTSHKQTDFNWWLMRFSRMYDIFDAIRIDHFLGFSRTWSIPAGLPDARGGRWVKSPGIQLFQSVERGLGKRPMIAEDLGHVTPVDIKLRHRTGMLPMRIFQFGFGTEPDSPDHLPHNYPVQSAAYTGTHDNDTLKGWYLKLKSEQKKLVQAYTGGDSSTIIWNCIRAVQSSPANLVIFPLQDILGLGTGGRMNIPGTLKGNWRWRLINDIPAELVKKLYQQTIMYGRL